MPDALIFDVDGTLAETEELHRRAFNETFAEAGLPWHWTREDYRRLLKTTGGKERIIRFMADAGWGPVDVPALHAAKTARYVALMQAGEIALRPGIAGLMAEARDAGLRLAVATTTSRPNVEALAAAVWGRQAGEVFDVIAAGDEVMRKKPFPDVYLLALERLGLEGDACLAFEDSLNGLRSAGEAGIPCVVSPSVYTEGEDMTGAALVVRGFDEIVLAGLDGLRVTQ